MLWEFTRDGRLLLGYNEKAKPVGYIDGDLAEKFKGWRRRKAPSYKENLFSSEVDTLSTDPSDMLKMARGFIAESRLGSGVNFTKSDTFVESKRISWSNALY